MLFTATTVKDTLANVQFFVAANLASGVDHMVVFLDAPQAPGQPEVARWLAEHPQVTCIPTDRRGWWAGERPGHLNVRQRTNANWLRAVLEPLPWAEWLFHVDGDEVVLADREAMAQVPDDVEVVWLPPWEAVSEWEQPERPTRFKRLLDDADLNLLHVLGAIGEPTNQAYFHGHVMGKSGIRPRSGLALGLHQAFRPGGPAGGMTGDGRPRRHEDPRLAVLHYDAPSGEEFVRKWNALAAAGPARYRADRAPTAKALRSLVSRDLPEEVRAKYLRRVYDLTTRDDVELLGDLGLLVSRDPLQEEATPRPLPATAAAELADRVEQLRDLPKAGYYVPDPEPSGGSRSRERSRLPRLRGSARRS